MSRTALPFAFFSVQTGFMAHPKVVRLASVMGVSREKAICMVLGLWTYATRYYPDGDLASMTDVEFTMACEVDDGAAAKHALAKTGWLDKGSILHDWGESQPGIMECLRHRKRRGSKR